MPPHQQVLARLPQQAEEEEPRVLQLWRFEPLHRRLPKKSGGGQNNHFDYYRHHDRDKGGSNKERQRHKYRSRDRGERFDKESLKKRF